MNDSLQESAMRHIVADEELESQLRGIIEQIEIRDSTGKVLGHYTPVVSPEERAAYEKARERFDPVELERRQREEQGQGSTLSEFWARMSAQDKVG